MGQFTFTKTDIEGVILIEPRVFGDERGYFMETYNKADFIEAGITCEFVQDNQSKSSKGVLRGLHYQRHCQAGAGHQGEVFDVGRLRKNSPTYTTMWGHSSQRRRTCLHPALRPWLLVLSDEAEFTYKCDEFYRPEDEGVSGWDDPAIGIEWPR